MKIERICLLGGTGFVGRHLTHKLAEAGIKSRIVSRRPHRHAALRTDIGSELVQADIDSVDSLAEQFEGCDAVINLIGILNEDSRQRFQRLHVSVTEHAVNACRQAGVDRYLHMSALNADETDGASQYLRSKGEAENRAFLLGKPKVAVTSFRPSVIFGPDDSFINRFNQLLDLPGPFPLACPDARFAPVYVCDVAESFLRALHLPETHGRHYELCGPDVFTLRQIIDYLLLLRHKKKHVFNLSDRLSRLQASLLQFLPGRPFTPDNFRSLQVPSVCHEDGLGQLGIEATPLAAIVPRYIAGKTAKAHLDELRQLPPTD